MLLENKICIVTGAASPRGIGRATAQLFALHGGRAIILDLDAGAAAAAAAELGGAHRGYACDVTDKAACEAAVAKVAEEFGRVDVLVNNAGITQAVKTLDIDDKGYDAIMNVNLRGTLYMSQAVIPHMKTQKDGAIVCMSSVSAQRGGGILGGPHYSAAKGGVLGLAKAMAREFGPDNIRVNAITPGLIQTDINAGKISPENKAKILEGIPLNRLGVVDDVARVCLFLASDLSGYLTGTVIDVNGGMLIH